RWKNVASYRPHTLGHDRAGCEDWGGGKCARKKKPRDVSPWASWFTREWIASGDFTAERTYRTASFSIFVFGMLRRSRRPSSSVSVIVATGPTARTVPSM